MSTLGAFVCVRNGFELDYCFEEAAKSLMKVCDKLILCDSDSTDGTREAMDRMADSDSRITVINWPWPNPKGEGHEWFVKWLNYARSHLDTDMCLYLDADEILSDSDECHAAIREAVESRRCLSVERLNFWRDASSLIPEGECCGKWCVRLGPQQYECVSDEPHSSGERPIVDLATKDERVKIFHLGFLRSRDAFYRKARVVLGAWFDTYDKRLEDGETSGKNLWETECKFADRLVPFGGYMPDAVQRWLSDRGHDTDKYLGARSSEDPVVHVAVTDSLSEPISVLHSGDLGDIIYGMAAFKAIGRIRLFYRDTNWLCKRIVERAHVIRPLLLSQPYIVSFEEHKGEPIHWNASGFRSNYDSCDRLTNAHFRHYNGVSGMPKISPTDSEPWITGISADARAYGKVVIHRTSRYNNRDFQWGNVVAHYGKRIIFVGSQDEHRWFCDSFGEVAYIPTANLLEMAKLIRGCDLFMGNQSCGYAIAEAMKVRSILEVDIWRPDCVFLRDGVQPSDGSCVLPDVSGSGRLELQRPSADLMTDINTSITPNGGWHWDGRRISMSFRDAVRKLEINKIATSKQDAEQKLVSYNVRRLPNLYRNRCEESRMLKFRRAVENSKLSP